MKTSNLPEYIKTLLDHQGVAVLTVDDGWVFTFTKDKLQKLIDSLGDSNNATIFVKSTAGLPQN